VASDTDLVRLRAKANFRSLGKRYGKQTPEVAKAAERLSPEQLRALEAGGEARLDVNGAEVVYFSEDVVVEREVTTSWLVESDGPYVAALDPTIDSALAAEGLARELVSHIQRLRREANYLVSDRIALGIEGPEPVLAAATTNRDFIASETLARTLELGQAISGADQRHAVDVEGHQVTFTVRRQNAD
jgi:isoleucyl-tRNA synthetase